MKQNRIFKNYITILLVSFFIEIIFKLVMKMSLLDFSTLRIFISCNIISLLISLFISKTGRIASKFLTFIVLFVFTMYALIQAGFSNFLGVFMSFGTTSQAGAVKDYIKDYIASFMWYYYLLFIPIVLLLIYYLFIEPRFNKKEEIKVTIVEKQKAINASLLALTSIILLVGLFYYTLVSTKMQNSIQLKSNISLFKNPDMPNIAVSQFGITTYGLIDIKSTVAPVEEEEYKFDTTSKKVETKAKEPDYIRHIDDKAWTKVSEEETNNNYKTLNSYYMSNNITDKNEYTAKFEGKNLILIMMESASNVFINEELYPNMYKLYSNGWSYDNAYSPRNACSTGNNEMGGMTSLFTINNTCTSNVYKYNKYPESIFNLFRNKGYKATSYHNYTEQYYRRKIIHPNMGSEHYYGVEELGIPYNNAYEEWPSDVALMEKVLENLNTEEKFMTWITTVTSHQPYSYGSKYGNLYVDTYVKLGYSRSLARYMSKLKVLDDALGTLVNGLEEKGLLENTVIVLYADHYPYGLPNKVLNEYYSYDVSVNNEVDRTPFVIYDSTQESMKSDLYTSYINIVPTLANLFNLDYDPRLYAGEDLFDKDYSNRVYFADGSWQDSKAFYNATTGKIKYTDELDTYSVEEIQAINYLINQKIKMSNLAIKTNYFKHLFESIEEEKVKETEIKKDKDEKGSS